MDCSKIYKITIKLRIKSVKKLTKRSIKLQRNNLENANSRLVTPEHVLGTHAENYLGSGLDK